MHPAYYRSNPVANGALLAVAATKGELKKLLEIFSLLNSMVDKYCPEIEKEGYKIFIAQMFLGGSYEVIKSFLGKSSVEQRRESNQQFNFVYHCRNAAFHGNKFTFDEKRIKEFRNGWIAKWRKYNIAENDQGTSLFPNKLKVEDVTFLLEDVIVLF